MRSGGFTLSAKCVRAGFLMLAALMVSACGSSSPAGGAPGGCAPGTADGVRCPAVGAACGYQAPNGYTSCTCNRDGKWHCDTANCPGGAPPPGSDCPASLVGMICPYPGVSCQCLAGPAGYQWACQ